MLFFFLPWKCGKNMNQELIDTCGNRLAIVSWTLAYLAIVAMWHVYLVLVTHATSPKQMRTGTTKQYSCTWQCLVWLFSECPIETWVAGKKKSPALLCNETRRKKKKGVPQTRLGAALCVCFEIWEQRWVKSSWLQINLQGKPSENKASRFTVVFPNLSPHHLWHQHQQYQPHFHQTALG